MCALAPEPHSRFGGSETTTGHLKSIHAVQHLEASVTLAPSWGEVCETIKAAQERGFRQEDPQAGDEVPGEQHNARVER